MTEKFTGLEPEKRERIINASMAEFALRGYDKASTNEMVKEAGISKGLLFHYFGNKQQLFLFLYAYAIQVSLDDFYQRLDLDETDLFKKMEQVMRIKMELLKKHPEMFVFLQNAYMETDPAIKPEIEKRNMEFLKINVGQIFRNTDTSKFVDGLDLDQAISIISWTTEGMTNDELKKCRYFNQELNYDELFHKAQRLLELFKKLFYVGRS